MKTIKILVAASEEMFDEKLAFSDVIGALNKALAPRGVELERIKWNPDTDGTIEEFCAKLSECEMCLTLYWNELAGNSEGELNAAYQDLKAGKNPRQLFVFFKEPSAEISEELRDFKANFVTRYGHFFCKFENVDTMNLQFVLQFEAYHNRQRSEQEKVITIKNGMLNVGDTKVLNLANVPFSAMNKECQRLQKELAELEEQLAAARAKHVADPEDEEAEETYFALRSKRKKLLEEFDKYEEHLYDIALNFAKLDESRYSDRIRRAKEEFEKGNVVAADEILDLEKTKRDAKLARQEAKNLKKQIEVFLAITKTAMANTKLSVSERFARACEAYEETVENAKLVVDYDDKLAEIHYNYAHLLLHFHKIQEAILHYSEAKKIYNRLKEFNFEKYAPTEAGMLCNIVYCLQEDTHFDISTADYYYDEALDIFRQLAEINPKQYEPSEISILSSYAYLLEANRQYAKAKKIFLRTLEICERKESRDLEDYSYEIQCIKDILDNIKMLESNQII